MTNKEFLFIYDAALCNPNGDPDQDNKPRMDRATKTNLVSDSRLKRYIRDYLIDKFATDSDQDVFVRMMGENKVSPEVRLWGLANQLVSEKIKLNVFVEKHPNLKAAFAILKSLKEIPKGDKKSGDEGKESSGKKNDNVKSVPFTGDHYDLYHEYFKSDKEFKEAFKAKELAEVNNEILSGLIKDYLADARLFGGAFAIGGFSRTIIGPVQVNIGYSLHPVELNDSNSTVTLMSGSTEGASNIGKKETLRYSLIAFTGTINAKRADIVNLSDTDLVLFRESLILSILNWKTDSKKNQYPRLYLEIDYKEGQTYGRLGDLRSLIQIKSTVENDRGIVDPKDFSQVRSLNHLSVDLKKLVAGIATLQQQGRIQKVRIWTSLDKTFTGAFDELVRLKSPKSSEEADAIPSPDDTVVAGQTMETDSLIEILPI